MRRIDIVLIGRNEGARLVEALTAAGRTGCRIVYVDSGSRDDSVARAREAGAIVVELDRATPFTAARARNAGVDALGSDAAPYLMLLDGDCAILPGWLETGAGFLDANPGHGLVTGWAIERHPEVSVFNRLCDWEWRRPSGPIRVCGGNMMVRRAAFEAIGGFCPQMIACEDEDFCLRLAQDGWALERLPQEMCFHDAAMTRLSEWWRRAERAGHGYAHIAQRHPSHSRIERLRAVIYGLALPLAALLAALVSPVLALAVLLAYPLNWWRSARGLQARGMAPGEARHQAVFLTLSKFPNLLGMLRFQIRHLRGRTMRLIEYK